MKRTATLLWTTIASLYKRQETSQCSGSLYITSTEDASVLGACSTWNGDININTDATGQLMLNGVQRLNGGLYCLNAPSLTALSANELTTINGTVNIGNLESLSSLSFPRMNNIEQFYLYYLSSLKSVDFGTNFVRASYVGIESTVLTSLDFLNNTAMDSITLNDNAFLSKVDLYGITNLAYTLHSANNGPSYEINMPNLISASGITVDGSYGVSLPNLKTLNGNLTLDHCYMSNFNASGLTQITEGDLQLISNPNLSTLDFSALVSINGSLHIEDNEYLRHLDSFKELATVGQRLFLTGNFDSASFGALESVRGNATISTTSKSTTICDDFQKLKDNGVIEGLLSCDPSTTSSATTSSTTPLDGDGDGDGNSNGNGNENSDVDLDDSAKKTGLSAVTIAGIVVGLVVGAIIISALTFGWIRSGKQVVVETQHTHDEGAENEQEMPGNERHPTQLPLGGYHEKSELYVDPRAVAELHNKPSKPEVHGTHPRIVLGFHELQNTELPPRQSSAIQ